VRTLTEQQIQDLGRPPQWLDVHVYAPSDHAWPAVLAGKLEVPVINHARRGACFHQIARQCAVAAPSIGSDDVVIVMWTYLSRLSLQWPARTTVPFCNIVDPNKFGWRTMILGFNRFFGLDISETRPTDQVEQHIQQYVHDSVKNTYLDPMGIYDRYHNSLLLQVMVDGFLRATGARVIHLSVEPDTCLEQLEYARSQLDISLREPYTIPDPRSWYDLSVDHHSCRVIHDPRIPPAENDMHPSVQHHENFADTIYRAYFSDRDLDAV
jgi:hypothetical protein